MCMCFGGDVWLWWSGVSKCVNGWGLGKAQVENLVGDMPFFHDCEILPEFRHAVFLGPIKNTKVTVGNVCCRRLQFYAAFARSIGRIWLKGYTLVDPQYQPLKSSVINWNILCVKSRSPWTSPIGHETDNTSLVLDLCI